MQQKDRRELTPEEKWEQATLANNFIFYKVMRHHPTECKEMLELLLGIKVDRIEMRNEETIDVDFMAKGIRLDLYVSDSDRVFDIEIQATDTGELPQRARYYQGIMDVDTLATGQAYDSLKESHVIFLCMEDPFRRWGKGLPVYTFENLCREDTTVPLGDRTYKRFFIVPTCATMLADKEQQAFFSLLSANKTGKSGTSFTDRLKALVEDAKHNTQWRMQFMTWEQQMNLERRQGREEGRKEGIAIGEERGERNARLEAARNLLAMHILTDEQIVQASGLSLSEVQQIAAELATYPSILALLS